jgi:hypothetical protein
MLDNKQLNMLIKFFNFVAKKDIEWGMSWKNHIKRYIKYQDETYGYNDYFQWKKWILRGLYD